MSAGLSGPSAASASGVEAPTPGSVGLVSSPHAATVRASAKPASCLSSIFNFLASACPGRPPAAVADQSQSRAENHERDAQRRDEESGARAGHQHDAYPVV